ncbi:MAG TPA: flagellar hook-associated protein FlgL [Bacillales bacterium]|nr:flagellar hook-associated protein FlgL [Bacillales bacterium]
MRVTQSMLTTGFLRNISESYERLAKYQEQLATGKKINRPSDDPVVAMMGMEYRSNLSQVKQYQRNLSTVYKWMDSSEAALDEATAVLQSVRELVVQASNGTYEDKQREAIAEEIGQLKNHLASIANTKVAGKYIFNGTATMQSPATLSNTDGDEMTEVAVNSQGGGVMIEVNHGVQIRVNVDPDKVFNQGLFDMLYQLEQKLRNGASGEDINDYIAKVDSRLNDILSVRAELGARYNRVEMIEKRLGEQKVIATQILSDNEDVDMEKVIMNLKMQESVHRAALAVGARIMQPSLMDFLR